MATTILEALQEMLLGKNQVPNLDVSNQPPFTPGMAPDVSGSYPQMSSQQMPPMQNMGGGQVNPVETQGENYSHEGMNSMQPGVAPVAPQREPWTPLSVGGGDSGGGLLSGLGSGISNYMSDPAKMARLAMGFNSMRLNPDQGLNTMLLDRIKTSGELEKSEKGKNKTILALRKMGMDEGQLQLLSENPELLKVAATAMYKKQFGGDVTADIQTWNAMTKGLSTADQDLAKRIKLGLKPRATSSQKIDLGNSYAIMEDGKVIYTIPKTLADAEAEKIAGKAIGESRQNYSDIKNTIEVQTSVLQSMLDDPAMNDIFGTMAGATPSIVQASVDAESRFGQIKGGAFLQAIQALRGMGSLSNAEGEAATRASTSLQLRMSPDSARREMKRMVAILKAGQERALRKTKVEPNYVPEYIQDWNDTYSSSGKPVKIGGSTITEVK